MSIHFPCAHLIFWVMMRRKRSVFQYVFVQCLAQHEVSAGLIQKTSSTCVLPAGLLPITFPVTRKKHWPLAWMERRDKVWGAFVRGTPFLSLLLDKSCRCLLVKPKDPFQICQPKAWLHFFGHTSISPVAPFSTSRSSSSLIVSYLPSTGSFLVLARAISGFIFSSFPPSSTHTQIPPNHHSAHLKQKCKLQKLYFTGIHTLCQNDGPKVWRVISPEFVSWWWMAVKPLWLLRLHCSWNNGGGHKSGSGEQRIKLLGRMAGSCRHDHLLTLKGFKNKWAETETILFGEAISCNVWHWSGHSWCVSSLMSPECPIKLGCYRPSATRAMLCMDDSPGTYWLPAWRKQLATLRFKWDWQYS